MKLNNLKPAKGSTKKSKRIARGQGSGRGGTATRGHKGAQSRSGYKRRIGFEGGQMPLQMRIPKRGFKNVNSKDYTGINLDRLQEIIEKHDLAEVTVDKLRELKIISKKELVKILGRGELKTKVDVSVHGVSKTAQEAIEKLGGQVKVI